MMRMEDCNKVFNKEAGSGEQMLVGFIYFKFTDISRETLKETSQIRLGEVLG